MFRNNDISDGGTPVLLTGPTAAVLSLDEVKKHLCVDFDDDDSLIDDMIAAAVGMLDPGAGGTLGRALRPQQWELQLKSFNDRRRSLRAHSNPLAIPLPYPPLISVDSVNYLDAAGSDRTLVLGADYRILRLSAPLDGCAIAPTFGKTWPIARADDASVRIQFTAGYPVADREASPAVLDMLPAPIKAWLKLVIGSLYENRESFIVGTRELAAELPPHILGMIETFRVG